LHFQDTFDTRKGRQEKTPAMGEEEQQGNSHGRKAATKKKYAVGCSIIGSVISILMGYGIYISLS
jgi:hypothetical protein